MHKLSIDLEEATLEQLIDACGKDFLELSVGQYKFIHSKKGFWWAYRTQIAIWKSLKNKYLNLVWNAGDTNQMGWQWIHKGEGKSAKEALIDLIKQLNK